MSRNFKVLWSLAAQRDLEDIVDFIARDKPKTAFRLFQSIRAKAEKLRSNSERGRRPPELAHLRGLPFRELVLPPWRLIYRIKDKAVEVLAFFDGRRDLEEVLYERLLRIG